MLIMNRTVRAWSARGIRSSRTGTRGGHRLASASGEGRARTSWKTQDPRVQSVPRVTAAALAVGGHESELEGGRGRGGERVSCIPPDKGPLTKCAGEKRCPPTKIRARTCNYCCYYYHHHY